MRIGSTMLVGAAALALTLSAGSASAAKRYHRHHATRPAAMQPQAADTSQYGNNPSKRYATRHMAERAVKTSTLYLSGNNPTKRYKVRHGSNLMMQATLSTSGNNPAKRYAAR